MIHHSISNDNVVVSIDQHGIRVVVQDLNSTDEMKFDGPGNVQEKYLEFKENITDEIDYSTALLFFKLKIEVP